MSELLTDAEHRLVERLADCAQEFLAICGDDRSLDGDVREFMHHVHILQNTVLAQAAARAYPTRYRVVGGDVRVERMPVGIDEHGKIRFSDEFSNTLTGPIAHETVDERLPLLVDGRTEIRFSDEIVEPVDLTKRTLTIDDVCVRDEKGRALIAGRPVMDVTAQRFVDRINSRIEREAT